MEYLESKFLTEYFTVGALLPDCIDRERVFNAMAEAYKIENPQNLYSLCDCGRVKSVKTVNDFFLDNRIKDYHAAIGRETAEDKDGAVIASKGQALITLQNQNLKSEDTVTDSEVISKLSAAANDGLITAMIVCGFLMNEGIVLPQNKEGGLKYLTKAAEWNSFDALVMCMHYDSLNAAYYGGILKETLADTPYCAYADRLIKDCETVKSDPAVRLLERAFSRGIAKREKYDQVISRILQSKGLSFKDKQKIILSANSSYHTAVSQLPLNLREWDRRNAALNLCLDRQAESGKVSRLLSNAHLVSSPKYRPTCICCEDEYLTDEYEAAIRQALSGCNVIRIDVADLPDAAFENAARNPVLRSVRESKPNAVIFVLRGEISSFKMMAVEEFLYARERASYKIGDGVTLDLSNLLPIIICDNKTASVFKPNCNVVYIAPLSKDEKRVIISGEINEDKGVFGIDNVSFEGAAIEKLADVKIEKALEVIDRIFQTVAFEGENLVTVSMVQECVGTLAGKENNLGFGGRND